MCIKQCLIEIYLQMNEYICLSNEIVICTYQNKTHESTVLNCITEGPLDKMYLNGWQIV